MRTIENMRFKKEVLKAKTSPDGTKTQTLVITLERRIPQLVTPLKRFQYFLVDLAFIASFNLLIALLISYNSAFQEMGMDYEMIGITILVFILFYYTFFETVFSTTPGKHFFGYTVINGFANKVNFDEVIIRSVSRLVPIEPFSCFTRRGWHDEWSKTYVVSYHEKAELRRLLGHVSESQVILD